MTKNRFVSFFTTPFQFLSQWRSLPFYELLSYPLMYASIPLIAYGVHPYPDQIIRIIVLTILCMYSGFFAALIWNDITDAEIDARVHPDRPIPSGRISSTKFFAIALVFSALTVFFAYLISVWCLFVVCCAAIFVAIHDKYLKKKVSLPAYSEIFTPIQWIVVVIFGYVAVWSAFPQAQAVTITVPILGSLQTTLFQLQNMGLFVLFTYFLDNAHDLPEGIHDVKGDKINGVKTYATSFGEKTAARISFLMYILAGILGILLFFRTILSWFFLIPFVIMWLYTLFFSYKLMKKPVELMSSFGSIVGRKGFTFLLVSFDIMVFDVLLQILF